MYPLNAGTYTFEPHVQPGYELAPPFTHPWTITIDPITCGIEFIGRTGGEYGAALALPAGWQPGDLAVVFVTLNSQAQPPVPPGYTHLAGMNTRAHSLRTRGTGCPTGSCKLETPESRRRRTAQRRWWSTETQGRAASQVMRPS